MKKMKLILILIIINISIFAQGKVRIKEIARISGVRTNQLVGMGLVVGLNGTGDSKGITPQMLKSLYRHFGTEVAGENAINSKNVAAVFITAELPPFKKRGDKIDIVVSSANNASSLEGGILLQTPLYAGGKEIYAFAQGQLNKVTGKKDSVLTTGYIMNGATIEKSLQFKLKKGDTIRLILARPDFTTASRVVDVINKRFSYDSARALDASTIEIREPYIFNNDIVSFISTVENLEVIPDRKSIIVINEKTGTIVFGDNIKVAPVAISHGELSIVIGAELDTDLTKDKKVKSEGGKGQTVYFKGTSVKEVVKMLNAIGATPMDIIAILQSLKSSGSIDAEIKTM